MDKSEASSIVEMEKKYRIQYQQKITRRKFSSFRSRNFPEGLVRFFGVSPERNICSSFKSLCLFYLNNESSLADVQTIRAHLTAALDQLAVIYVAVSCHQ